MAQDKTLLGVALMIAFCVMAPLLDVSSKLATAAIPVGQITTARFVVQGALMLPVVLIMGLSLRLTPRMAGLVTARAFFLMLSTFCFVGAVTVMPIADALVIVFIEPFIVMLLGKWIFGDEVGPRRIAASVVAFCGALLVIQPSLALYGLVTLYPLGTALSFSFYMLVTRGMSRSMHSVVMQFHTSAAGILMCVPLMWVMDGTGIAILDPVMPQGWFWLWLFGVGFWAATSHMCMTLALAYAPSATIAPLQYFEIIVAVALGYLVFGDFPNVLTWAGIVLISGAGIYMIHRERVAAARRRAELITPA